MPAPAHAKILTEVQKHINAGKTQLAVKAICNAVYVTFPKEDLGPQAKKNAASAVKQTLKDLKIVVPRTLMKLLEDSLKMAVEKAKAAAANATKHAAKKAPGGSKRKR